MAMSIWMMMMPICMPDGAVSRDMEKRTLKVLKRLGSKWQEPNGQNYRYLR